MGGILALLSARSSFIGGLPLSRGGLAALEHVAVTEGS